MLICVKIGRAIEHYGQLRGLTQSELAAQVGLNQGNLSRLLSGRQDLSVSRLHAIASALGVKASDILAYAENGDEMAARWRHVYSQMNDAERDAALRILEPRSQYPAKKP